MSGSNKRTYFVTYITESQAGQLFCGWAQVSRPVPICNGGDIEDIQRIILKEDEERKQVTLLSWQRFEDADG